MSYTSENEKLSRTSFLDLKIILKDRKFTTSVYRKTSFSGFYTYFESFFSNELTSLVKSTLLLIAFLG